MTLLGTEGSIMNYISTHILTKRMTVLLAMIYALQKLISTHILTKRMTYRTGSLGHYSVISTHILTKRMTEPEYLASVFLNFNSHPHEEDDEKPLPGIRKEHISTHILTKRMTCIRRLHGHANCYFNSHPHEEDDNL